MKKSRFKDKVAIITGASSMMHDARCKIHDARFKVQVKDLCGSGKKEEEIS